MSQIENSKRASLPAVHFRDLEIRILNLFRISKFELRISKGKLDHFVNFVVTKKTWLVSEATGKAVFRSKPAQTADTSEHWRNRPCVAHCPGARCRRFSSGRATAPR